MILSASASDVCIVSVLVDNGPVKMSVTSVEGGGDRGGGSKFLPHILQHSFWFVFNKREYTVFWGLSTL